MCCNTPSVWPQHYFVMDTETVSPPWCKNVMLRSLSHSAIQMIADLNRIELSDAKPGLDLCPIGLFVRKGPTTDQMILCVVSVFGSYGNESCR